MDFEQARDEASKFADDERVYIRYQVSLEDEGEDLMAEFRAARGGELSGAPVPKTIEIGGVGKSETRMRRKMETWKMRNAPPTPGPVAVVMEEDAGELRHLRWKKMVQRWTLLAAVDDGWSLGHYLAIASAVASHDYAKFPPFSEAGDEGESLFSYMTEMMTLLKAEIQPPTLIRDATLRDKFALSARRHKPLDKGQSDLYLISRVGEHVETIAWPSKIPPTAVISLWTWFKDGIEIENARGPYLKLETKGNFSIFASVRLLDSLGRLVAEGNSKSKIVNAMKKCARCEGWLHLREFEKTKCTWMYSLDSSSSSGREQEVTIPTPPLREWRGEVARDGKAYEYANFPRNAILARKIKRRGPMRGAEEWEGRHDEHEKAPDLPTLDDPGSLRVDFKDEIYRSRKVFDKVLELYLL